MNDRLLFLDWAGVSREILEKENCLSEFLGDVQASMPNTKLTVVIASATLPQDIIRDILPALTQSPEIRGVASTMPGQFKYIQNSASTEPVSLQQLKILYSNAPMLLLDDKKGISGPIPKIATFENNLAEEPDLQRPLSPLHTHQVFGQHIAEHLGVRKSTRQAAYYNELIQSIANKYHAIEQAALQLH